MKDSRMEGLVVDLSHRESGQLSKHLVYVQYGAIRRQDRDGLANGIGDGAKVRRFLAELLLGGLKVMNVCIDPTPADKVRLLIVDVAPPRSGTNDRLRRNGEGVFPSCRLPGTA